MLQIATLLGLVGSSIVLLSGFYYIFLAIYIIIVTKGGRGAEGIAVVLCVFIGVIFIVAGGFAVGSTFLARNLPTLGGLLQMSIGVGGLLICIQNYTDLWVALFALGFALIAVSGVLHIVGSFTAH